MFTNILLDLFKKSLGKVKKKNTEDPNVVTADDRVFEAVSKKAEETVRTTDEKSIDRREMYERMRKSMEEARMENEADPQVETADSSVFDDLMKEIEELKKKVDVPVQVGDTFPIDTTPTTSRGASSLGTMMMTQSNGGSLALRLNPDMGSPVNSVRVPDNTPVRVLQYSEKSIRLDGRDSKWVFVDFNSEQGWILDSYLSHNDA